MSRLLGVVALCCALAACTTVTPGNAVKDPQVVVTPGPSFGPPRDLSAFDSCKVLPVEPAQWWMRKASAPPTPEPKTPGSCVYQFGDGGPKDERVFVGVRDIAYDDEKTTFPDGHIGNFAGHTTYLYCGTSDTHTECTAWAALAPEKTLIVSVLQRDSDESYMLPAVPRYLTYILDRLPKAS